MTDRTTTFEAIGTTWSIAVRSPITLAQWQHVLVAIRERIEIFDKTYSRFRNDSLVSRMSRRKGTYQLPADAYPLIHFYDQLYQATSGSITPLIGQTMVDAGYDATYSLTPKVLSKPPTWEEVITYDERNITLKKPALLDVGAAGKGYLVDIIGALLHKAGIDAYTINAGGDLLHAGPANHPLRVGLENPYDLSQVVGVVRLAQGSLCASAGNKRAWQSMQHIVNPHTLRSPTKVVATWVIASTAMIADGIASALFFTKPATLRRYFDFSYAMLDANMTMHYDQDFSASLFKEARI